MTQRRLRSRTTRPEDPPHIHVGTPAASKKVSAVTAMNLVKVTFVILGKKAEPMIQDKVTNQCARNFLSKKNWSMTHVGTSSSGTLVNESTPGDNITIMISSVIYSCQ